MKITIKSNALKFVFLVPTGLAVRALLRDSEIDKDEKSIIAKETCKELKRAKKTMGKLKLMQASTSDGRQSIEITL